jgi:hypothetical protein
MSYFKLANFREEVLNGGMAKSHRFEVAVYAPPFLGGGIEKLSSLFAEGTQLPQTRLNVSPMRMFGPPRYLPHYAEYGGDNLSINFYLDRSMEVKRFFDRWIDGVIDRKSNLAYYYSNYISSIEIAQLDEQDKVTYAVKLIDAYPIAVNPVQLDSGNIGVSRLNVTFTYKKWEPFVTANQIQPARAEINPKKDPKPVKDQRKVDYLGQSTPLGGTIDDPMSFETNSFFGA